MTMNTTAARNAELAHAADQILDIVITLATIRRMPSREALNTARDVLAEQHKCTKRRAANEIRDAMVRRAASNPKTRMVAESYLDGRTT